MTLGPGSRLGNYTILRALGSGGMADVFEAHDETLDRNVALKVLPLEYTRNPQLVARFQKEVRAAAKLNHRGIVTVFEVGQQDSYHYFSMRLLPGGDLRRRIERGLSSLEALAILRELADAFAHAHARGFVHRDVKPENVMFDEQGFPVLTDFGIAKALDTNTHMTRTGMTMGTPRYLSPEQASGKPVDARADLYSLGVMFFEMLTGRPPYDAEESMAVIFKHVTEPIPVLPADFARFQPLLEKLMAKDPNQRFASAGELIQAIDALAPRSPTQEIKPSQVRTAENPLIANLLTPSPLRTPAPAPMTPRPVTPAPRSPAAPAATGPRATPPESGEIALAPPVTTAPPRPAMVPPRVTAPSGAPPMAAPTAQAPSTAAAVAPARPSEVAPAPAAPRTVPLGWAAAAVVGVAAIAVAIVMFRSAPKEAAPAVSAPATSVPAFEEQQRQKALELAQQEAQQQIEAQKQAEAQKAEAAQRAEADAAAKRKADADAAARREADAAAKREADAKAAAQRDAEEKAQAQRRADAEAAARREAEAQAQAKRDAEAKAEEQRRAQAQAEARRQAEADAAAKKQAEEQARRQQEQREAAAAPEAQAAPSGPHSEHSTVKARFTVINDCRRAVDLVWMDYSGKPQAFGTIKPGASQSVDSYTAALWRVLDQSRRHSVLKERTLSAPDEQLYVCGKPPAPKSTEEEEAKERARRPTGF